MTSSNVSWITKNRKGIILHHPYTGPMDPANVPKRKKGDIKGWSKHSRRRFREWLITHEPISGYVSWDVTLTIPGDPIPWDNPEWRDIFKRWKDRILLQEWSAVWRLEIQWRGQPHWHCIMLSPPSVRLRDITTLWLSVCGPDRARLPGADRYASRVKQATDYNAAMDRYMVDHVSKRKQAQIAHNLGRHWGIIGRDKWRVLSSTETALQSRAVSVRVSRIISKLERRRIPDKRSRVVPYSLKSAASHIDLGGGRYRVTYPGGHQDIDMSSPTAADDFARVFRRARGNVWALKLSRRRSNVAGQKFGEHWASNIDRIIENATQNTERETS